jgi:hypothetical protein
VFLPSVCIEGTDPGDVMIQLGCKIMQEHTRCRDKLQNQVYKGFPLLELSFRTAVFLINTIGNN